MLWRDLRISCVDIDNKLWILMGDYDIVRKPKKRQRGDPIDTAEMADFNSCIHDIQVEDVNCKGLPFTWNNKRGDNSTVLSRIDRVLSNDAWNQEFANVEAVVMPPGISYHCPILVTINAHRGKGRKPFKFFDFWMNNEKFQSILIASWEEQVVGTKMYQIYMKLKRLKPCLKELNKKQFSNITDRVRVAKEELNNVQVLIQQGGGSNDIRKQEMECKLKYVSLCKDEETFYRQKSRVKWLQKGDKNSAYFFRKMHSHRAKNKIMSITIMEGQLVHGEENVHHTIKYNMQ